MEIFFRKKLVVFYKMKKIFSILLCVSVLYCLWVAAMQTLAAQTQRIRTTTIKADTLIVGADSLPYLLFTNCYPDENGPLPLIIFFHGAGERGSDNHRQLVHSSEYFLADSVCDRYSFRFFAPQCPVYERWVNTDWKLPAHTMPIEPTVSMKMSILLIDSMIKSNIVDTNRVYAAGLSMGGFGVWDLLQRRPNLCAAAVPMCGGGDPSFAPRLTDVALRIYHGALDKLVMPVRSQQMYDAIVKAGGTKARFTMYPDLGHGCWNRPFQQDDTIDWLFLQRK